MRRGGQGSRQLLRGRLQVRILPGSPFLPENVTYLRGQPNAWG